MTARVTSLKGAAAGQYYVAEVGSYYLAGGEPKGRWFGDAATQLGISGVVDDGQFVAVMNGVDPFSGVGLGRAFGEKSVRGYDMTFSAPKSVSVLAAVADAEVRVEVLAAHDAAVDAVLGFVQRHAQTRFRVAGEVVSVDVSGIAVGVFRQHVSRELDPQLHSHAVIASKVLSPDGRWLALDARSLMADQTVLSSLYHAGLRAELTLRLGVGWEPPVNGIAEMAGVDGGVLGEFSQRSGQVEARREVKLARFRASLGREPTGRERWRLEREAVKDSRRSKPPPVDAAELAGRWVERLGGLGVAPQELVAGVVGRVLEPGRELDLDPWGALADRVLGELTDTRSTWRHPDVVREFARAVPTTTGLPAAEIVGSMEAAAAGFAGEWLVELARPIPAGSRVRRSDGRPEFESPLERRYTTGWILEQEAELAGWAMRRWDHNGHPAALADVGLDMAQHAAAEAAAGTQPLVVIVGPAGTGKTTALRPAVAELARQGRALFAVAPTATAAAVLGGETGMGADTIDKLLVEYRRRGGPRPGFRLRHGTTVVVDEAAMVATPTLAELAGLADVNGWRVVLVGDPLQFLAVGRGGMFDWLVEHGPAIELDRVHRFDQPWERAASLELRQGQPDALEVYERYGRLHRGEPGELDFDVLDHWWALRGQGASVAILAASHDTVFRLNELAQQHRIDLFDLDPEGRHVWTAAGYRLLVGDEIATRQNDRLLRTDRGEMVRNRGQWTITRIEPVGAITVTGPAGTVRLPGDYVHNHVELAYAQTGHAAQGRTVDHSLLVVDSNIDNRGVYVPMTRGRVENHAYVALEPDDPRTAREVLAEAVAKNWADLPAIAYRDHLAQQPPPDLTPKAVPQPPLSAHGLRHVAGELDRVDRLNIPHQQTELRRDLDHAHRAAVEHANAAARLDRVRAERDRAAEQLEAIHPWNPFAGRRRDTLEQENRTLNDQVHQARQDLDTKGRQLAEANADVAKRAAWLETHGPELQRRPGLQAALDRDLNARTRQAAEHEPPAWALRELGARPEHPGRAAVWDRAVGHASQYRTIHAVTDPERALGARPGYIDHHSTDWGRTAHILQQANEQLGRHDHLSRERGLDRGMGISR
ncbi:MAG: MobF family relaxase [Acidimicrobiales bacterium]